MKTFTTLLAAGAVSLMAASAASAQMMTDFDSDGDGMLSMEEYGVENNALRSFGGYDTNADGTIDENEYRAGTFMRYDRDRDGMLNEEEYGLYEEDEGLFDM